MCYFFYRGQNVESQLLYLTFARSRKPCDALNQHLRLEVRIRLAQVHKLDYHVFLNHT